jgi:uncharacterized membrane protein YgcG
LDEAQYQPCLIKRKMSAGYKLEETRLVQERSATSAANADYLNFGAGVPDGKIWIVLSAGYMPSVAETQVVSFSVVSLKTNSNFGLINPVSLNLNPAQATFIEQGMDYMLLPGDLIQARRVTHTAGSTMSCIIRFIEIDQPIYTYEEPLLVMRQKRGISSIRSMMGSGSARSSGVGSIGGGRGSGRGGSVPV